jgi:hypothetical protein
MALRNNKTNCSMANMGSSNNMAGKVSVPVNLRELQPNTAKAINNLIPNTMANSGE